MSDTCSAALAPIYLLRRDFTLEEEPVVLAQDGSIDVRRVIASLKTIDHPHPLEALHQGLHELAAFALFAATTSLPRDQELVLSRDVNRRLKAIRL